MYFQTWFEDNYNSSYDFLLYSVSFIVITAPLWLVQETFMCHKQTHTERLLLLCIPLQHTKRFLSFMDVNPCRVSVSWAVTHTGKMLCYCLRRNCHLIWSNREKQGQTVQRLIESGCLCWCCGGWAHEKELLNGPYMQAKKHKNCICSAFPNPELLVSSTSRFISKENGSFKTQTF